MLLVCNVSTYELYTFTVLRGCTVNLLLTHSFHIPTGVTLGQYSIYIQRLQNKPKTNKSNMKMKMIMTYHPWP